MRRTESRVRCVRSWKLSVGVSFDTRVSAIVAAIRLMVGLGRSAWGIGFPKYCSSC